MENVIQKIKYLVPILMLLSTAFIADVRAETEPEGIGGTGVRPERPEVFERPDIYIPESISTDSGGEWIGTDTDNGSAMDEVVSDSEDAGEAGSDTGQTDPQPAD